MAFQQLHSEGIADAAAYHRNSSYQQKLALETLRMVPWEGRERVLDIGCGDGKVTAYIASTITKEAVVGVDISSSMIGFARLNYPQGNLTFERQDGAEIAFQEEFERVVSFSALHWILDQEKVLGAIYRALVPGGWACLQTYGGRTRGTTVIAEELVHSEKWARYFPNFTKQRAFFTEQEYRALLERAGFTNILVIEARTIAEFPNRQALLDFVAPVLNYIRHLPKELQQEFIEEVVDELGAAGGTSSSGRLYYENVILQATARKKP